MPTTRFSDINMQRDEARDGDTDEFFATIDFAKVYHEGSFQGDPSIAQHRSAEVLCRSPLPLTDHLKWIVCRSEAERETLIHLAGQAGRLLRPKIITSDDGKVFEKRFAFAERVYASPEGITFHLSPRHDGAALKVRVTVYDDVQRLVFDQIYNELPAKSSSGGSWISRVNLTDGLYSVEMQIDDHLAYQNYVFVGEALF